MRDHREYQHPCAACVTQNLTIVPKLTSLDSFCSLRSNNLRGCNVCQTISFTGPAATNLRQVLPKPFGRFARDPLEQVPPTGRS